jgi:hypothetical protein
MIFPCSYLKKIILSRKVKIILNTKVLIYQIELIIQMFSKSILNIKTLSRYNYNYQLIK